MHLFIIEAPGKIKAIEAVLSSLGVDAEVQATKGHLYSMPDSLHPLGIDERFYEHERRLREPLVVSYMRDKATRAERIFIATDADSEGDAIAWDVGELLRDLHPEPLRVRLKGMDKDSVAAALDDAQPLLKEEAVPARTRAILDRLIGHSFSKDGVAVGRVGTALLGLVRDQKPSIHRLRLVAPASDGGRPWVTELDVRAPLTLEVARKLSQTPFPALSMKSEAADHVRPPLHMGDIMVAAGDRLDMSPKEAETSMQRLYEGGQLSYPRSGSRGMSSSVARRLQDIVRKAGYKYDGDRVAPKAASETHDAPYPIGKIDINKNPERLGDDQGVRTLVGRSLVRAGQPVTRQSADSRKMRACLVEYGFAEEVIEVLLRQEWTRDQGPRFPDQESWPESEVIQRRPDTVLLEAAISAGLGRPSTWAKHIEAFMQRGLVTDDLNLTGKGRAWLEASPHTLTDVRMSAAIESACERTDLSGLDQPGREPWEVLAERIVKALPAPIRMPLVEAANATPSQIRRTRDQDLLEVANHATLRELAPPQPASSPTASTT